jgi:hypothetical protein
MLAPPVGVRPAPVRMTLAQSEDIKARYFKLFKV